MKFIEILGAHCGKCRATEEAARQAAARRREGRSIPCRRRRLPRFLPRPTYAGRSAGADDEDARSSRSADHRQCGQYTRRRHVHLHHQRARLVLFTGNLTGATGKHGISIQADDVTLDLNGFALVRGSGGLRGVDVPAARSGFCIRNGSVRGWFGGGVRADAAVTLAEKLRLSDNIGPTGLVVGNGSLVKDCVNCAPLSVMMWGRQKARVPRIGGRTEPRAEFYEDVTDR